MEPEDCFQNNLTETYNNYLESIFHQVMVDRLSGSPLWVQFLKTTTLADGAECLAGRPNWALVDVSSGALRQLPSPWT